MLLDVDMGYCREEGGQERYPTELENKQKIHVLLHLHLPQVNCTFRM